MQQFEELIRRLRKSPSDDELKKKIHDWIQENPDNPEIARSLEEHWQLLEPDLSQFELKRLEQLLEDIHVKAGINSRRRWIQHSGKAVGYRFLNVLKIAAAIAIPLVIYFAFQHFRVSNSQLPENILVQQSNKSTLHFFLPDSSEVWLNSGSQLRYSSSLHEKKQRLVSLTGQAYFKVRHDAVHPFIVQTPKMDIRVLGTSFDVSAYPDETLVYSTLEEGSVALFDKKGRQLEKLAPGEQAVFDTEKLSLAKTRIKTTDYTSWKTGKLIFRDTDISEVAKKLERRYGYTITVSQELLDENPTYTFSIQQESLEEICRLIELSTGAKASVDGQHIHFEKIEKGSVRATTPKH